jgi:hypothetical protein
MTKRRIATIALGMNLGGKTQAIMEAVLHNTVFR